jgi:uncharacterized protein
MKLIDANLLLYAVNSDAPSHPKAKRWLEQAFSSGDTVGFAGSVLLAFLRLTTRAGLFSCPLSPDAAFDLIAEWLDQPAAVLVEPGRRHLEIMRELLDPLGTAGNLTSDAHLAALSIEYHAELCSCDGDFARFPGVDWSNPLA